MKARLTIRAARLLVQGLRVCFDASKYTNDVEARIEELIAEKVSGREITAPEAPAAPQGARVIDLMEALRASLKGGTRAAPGKAVERAASRADKVRGREKERPARPAKKTAAKRTLRRAA